MTAPADLDKQSKDLWRVAHATLDEAGTWRDSDAKLLEMMVRAEAEVRGLREAIGDSYVAKGSREQDVAHPLIKPLHEAERHFLDYARELRFTPRTRGEEPAKPPKGKLDV